MHSTFGNEPVVKAEPRPHLVQALADIKKTLTKHDRAIAVMASGTGKTLVALWAAEQQAPKTVLVLVPSLVMLQQTLHEWSKHSREPFSYLAVCSDPSVDLEDRQDIKDFPSLMCYEFSRAVRDATFRKTRYRCEACDPRCELEFHRRGHPKDASAFNAQGLCRDCHEAGHDRRFLRNAAAAANCGDLGDARKHHSTTDTFRGRLVPAGTARSEASCPREQSQLLSGPWDMVLDPTGGIGPVIELRDIATKNGSGRLIPVHPDLRQSLDAYRDLSTGSGPVIRSERGGPMMPLSIVVWFNRAFRNIGLHGCSSHSGRRTFITRAARLVHKAGGSLRDVQLLAGHRSIQTTQRYIDGDSDVQRKLVAMI